MEGLQQELAEVQRAADEAEGRVMELCEGTDSLHQELQVWVTCDALRRVTCDVL